MYITKKQLAAQLGISRSTLYRWFQELKIPIPKGLISPKEAVRIRQQLEMGKMVN